MLKKLLLASALLLGFVSSSAAAGICGNGTLRYVMNPKSGREDMICLPPASFTIYAATSTAIFSPFGFRSSTGSFTGHVRIGATEFGTFQNVGVGYPSLSIYTTGGDALNVGNANGWVELAVEVVSLEMGLLTKNDEFLAVKDFFPNGGYTYGNGGLKVSYGTGVGDGDTMVGNGTTKPGIRLFSWGTGNGGGATAGQIGWGDKTNGVQLGLLSDLGNGYSGAFYLLGDSLQAPFGEIAEFDVLDRRLQPSDARIAFTVGRIDSNVGGFRYDIGIRNAANAIYIPFGITPSGVYIDNNAGVDGIDGSAFLTLGQSPGTAGMGSFKILPGASLMATPEQGLFETDPNGTIYYDRDALTRGQFAFIDVSQTWNAPQNFMGVAKFDTTTATFTNVAISTSLVYVSSTVRFIASQNNYSIPNTTLLKASATVAFSFTGFVAQKNGSCFQIISVGTNTITYVQESASSTAGNRIWTNTGANTSSSGTASGGGTVEFCYDADVTRWRQLR